jgi:hypothetical protein
MSEIVLMRLTACPTGDPKDERVLEIVLELDDVLPAEAPVARAVAAVRIYSRGDLSVLQAHGLKSVGYAALGFPDFVVTAAGHVESTAIAGATVAFSVAEDPVSKAQKLSVQESWSGIRFLTQPLDAPAIDVIRRQPGT